MGRRKGKPRPVYGPNRKMHTHTCEWCGVRFDSARPESRTCSNAHRLRWNRWLKKAAAAGKGTPAVGPRGDYRKQFFVPALSRGK